MDLSRHKADSKASYSHYFELLQLKMTQYDVQPENVYNMDEKGFLMGQLQKARRVISKDSELQAKLITAGQDGSR